MNLKFCKQILGIERFFFASRTIFWIIHVGSEFRLLIAFLIIVALLHRRGNLYRFDDFLTAWSEKLRAKEPTSMTVRLQKDVDKYKVESISIFI